MDTIFSEQSRRKRGKISTLPKFSYFSIYRKRGNKKSGKAENWTDLFH